MQNQYNSKELGSEENKQEYHHIDKQLENAKAEIDKSNEAKPKVEIKSQENVLSGLSDKERSQAAEAENKNVGVYGNDIDSSASATVNGGLSEKERADAAEADGKIGDKTKGGLSDRERREAADESW